MVGELKAPSVIVFPFGTRNVRGPTKSSHHVVRIKLMNINAKQRAAFRKNTKANVSCSPKSQARRLNTPSSTP
jgi:hypothetical protein